MNEEFHLCNAPCEYCGDPLHEHAPSELKSCALDLEQREIDDHVRLEALARLLHAMKPVSVSNAVQRCIDLDWYGL